MDRKKAKALLASTAVEMVTAEELLRKKKKELKKADDELAAANLKHEIQTVAVALKGIKQHRRLLKQELAGNQNASNKDNQPLAATA
jgi:hypothetical protein